MGRMKDEALDPRPVSGGQREAEIIAAIAAEVNTDVEGFHSSGGDVHLNLISVTGLITARDIAKRLGLHVLTEQISFLLEKVRAGATTLPLMSERGEFHR